MKLTTILIEATSDTTIHDEMEVKNKNKKIEFCMRDMKNEDV